MTNRLTHREAVERDSWKAHSHRCACGRMIYGCCCDDRNAPKACSTCFTTWHRKQQAKRGQI